MVAISKFLFNFQIAASKMILSFTRISQNPLSNSNRSSKFYNPISTHWKALVKLVCKVITKND